MEKAVIYIHGKGGSAEEATYYAQFFRNCDVIGLEYAAQFPWEAKEEFFSIHALSNQQIEKAYFISPVVDMEKLIVDMMEWADVTENELQEKKKIQTDFGETLSWDYLCYVRENPVAWTIPTHILYGEKDHLTSRETISKFAKQTNAVLTVMKNGEHWFHTEEQMKFLSDWMRSDGYVF